MFDVAGSAYLSVDTIDLDSTDNEIGQADYEDNTLNGDEPTQYATNVEVARHMWASVIGG